MCLSPDRGSGQDSEKLRVLVVDDEPTLRLGFAYALTSKTLSVETAATGRQALEKLADSRFDVMMLDLRMPEMDGLGVIETLRRDGNAIPIILCSAVLHAGAAVRAIRNQVVDFLLKPVRPDDLRQMINFVINPERAAFPQAMKAARDGRRDEAIRILEDETSLNCQGILWLRMLTALRDGDPHLEEMVNAGLSIMAFNTVGLP